MNKTTRFTVYTNDSTGRPATIGFARQVQWGKITKVFRHYKYTMTRYLRIKRVLTGREG